MKLDVKKIVKIVAIILVAVIIPVGGVLIYRDSDEAGVIPTYLWSSEDTFDINKITSYNLSSEGEFKILQLTDPQFNYPLYFSGRTTAVITGLVEETHPDLIIITGDVAGTPINGIVYQQFVKFMDLIGIPYAVVFGNHDSEGRATKEKLANILKGGEYSVFDYGPSNITGVGNYVINVKDGDNIAWSLFMIDSNEYLDKDLRQNDSKYDYIHQDQIDWYQWNVENLKSSNGGTLNSLAFFHIPLVEFTQGWASKRPDTHYFGDKREDECPSGTNSGFFDKALELNSTKGIFCGHDHINDYSVDYQGIRLTYGLKTGYGSYYDKEVMGGLLITLSAGDYTVEQIFKN